MSAGGNGHRAASQRRRTSGGGGARLDDTPSLGDLVVVMLAGTLVGLRDRLAHDGFEEEAELAADLVDLTDDYLVRRLPGPATS